MPRMSSFTAGVLTTEQIADFQMVFDEVCIEFGFADDDREARDLIAEALMNLAHKKEADRIEAIAVARLAARRARDLSLPA